MKNNITLLMILTLISLFSCSEYEDINTNIYGATDEDFKKEGLAYGAPFLSMQQLVIPIGSPDKKTGPGNDLQNTDLISSGNYIGYFGNNNNWGFNIESNWNFPESRMNYAQGNFYSKMFREWQEINKLTKDSSEPFDQQVLAVANIVKILGWSRATDVFGPIVYTNAGKGDIAPKLDSQEVVYTNMLKDLANSVQVLKDAPKNLLQKYDLIYDGDTGKWIKLANSLMLRLAVRTHFKNQGLASEYVTKALDPANGGVITDIADEAKIGTSSKQPLMNPMIPSVEEYAETRMGATIWSYLIGYNDYRLDSYFTRGDYYGAPSFYCVAPANKIGKKTGTGTAEYASKPKINPATPVYWLRASEVYFLKAEAALYGLTGGDAKSFYEKGIKTSFEEQKAYWQDNYVEGTAKPAILNDYKYGSWREKYSGDISNGNVSISWNDIDRGKDEVEQRLQKIITQKYLALYPNAVEAWTEYRRTGYPFIMKPFDNAAPSRIGCEDCLAPERFRFAPSEYNSNPNMSEVPALLGGQDTGGTKLWWVRDNRPVQP